MDALRLGRHHGTSALNLSRSFLQTSVPNGREDPSKNWVSPSTSCRNRDSRAP